MKQLIQNYSFDASEKKITFTDFPLSLEGFLIITNVTDGIIIYSFADSAKRGSYANQVLTLQFDTTSMSDTDELQIYYDDGSSEATEETLRRLLKIAECLAVTDANQRQRVVVDTLPTLGTVTTVTTVTNLTSMNQIAGVDARFFLAETARNAYANGIRSKLT